MISLKKYSTHPFDEMCVLLWIAAGCCRTQNQRLRWHYRTIEILEKKKCLCSKNFLEQWQRDGSSCVWDNKTNNRRMLRLLLRTINSDYTKTLRFYFYNLARSYVEYELENTLKVLSYSSCLAFQLICRILPAVMNAGDCWTEESKHNNKLQHKKIHRDIYLTKSAYNIDI